jgi:hypothetical protein
MSSFVAVKRKIINLLQDSEKPSSDPIEGILTPASLLLDAIQAASIAVSQRVWKPQTLAIAAAATDVDLPDGILDVEGVLDIKNNAFLSRAQIIEGSTSDRGTTWTEFPYGKISFSDALEEGGVLYYSSTWSVPDSIVDTDTLDPPTKLSLAMSYYGACYCMMARASGSSDIRQFGTKVDSGTPTDIPQLLVGNDFFRKFEIEMSRFPAQRKGSS